MNSGSDDSVAWQVSLAVTNLLWIITHTEPPFSSVSFSVNLCISWLCLYCCWWRWKCSTWMPVDTVHCRYCDAQDGKDDLKFSLQQMIVLMFCWNCLFSAFFFVIFRTETCCYWSNIAQSNCFMFRVLRLKMHLQLFATVLSIFEKGTRGLIAISICVVLLAKDRFPGGTGADVCDALEVTIRLYSNLSQLFHKIVLSFMIFVSLIMKQFLRNQR